MIIRISCAAIIIISCSYVGMKISNSLAGRVRTLGAILAAMAEIKSCIASVRMPLEEIYASLGQVKGPVGEFFLKISPGCDWGKHIHILPELTGRDKSVILRMSRKLGVSPAEQQIEEIGLAESLIEQSLAQAKIDMAQNARVYRAMSFFTGVVIAILLI